MKKTIKRDIVISSTNEETRIALCENDKLVELYIERPDNERMIGDIYKGRIRKILPGLKAIFVDIGMPNDGFMHFSDFENTLDDFLDDDDEIEDDEKNQSKPSTKSNIDPIKSLKVGEELLVQIIKEPYANKGCRVTTKLALAGRFLVILPNQSHVGISRKIRSNDERKRLRKFAKTIIPEGFGAIIRTVCIGKSEEMLEADLKHLLKKWKDIEKKSRSFAAPNSVYSDSGMSASIIRDLFSDNVNQVVVDTRKEYHALKSYIKDVAPELLNRLEYYKGDAPVFDHYYNIERDLQRSIEKKVWMRNGGYLFIEHTEALTSIDINSGRFMGKKEQEANSLKVNLDSAKEIARQIRLRDIGGLIIIDFIDMRHAENRKKLYDEFVKEF
ncbi:MAG: Rne/Rng family ribonuclease, partial [Calditrichaeota bacterium]|nr:Rne/Rng family ribonuclease [Calditrichota bacterium]